ncbi:flagellar hook-associated family protein [Rhizobiaceae bacterium BDR2-2]|uniref:Flagellin n=1 Tax=Ectorhizobium quercum TaxID=2965071 RepID=A0AAE3STH4_9HYPH|nr:flagellar hook-associated family protein [Ectorhizobium quercum]MCX8996125.1 flagellar hook-associated family protein [Ectorhizobium quercum]MCX8998836.1 flagellar hook-associated family protein [Ectorhizobium quercum]
MKTSTISSLSVSNAIQLVVSHAQKEAVKLENESVTGTYYDVGLELGVKTSQSLNFNRESARLQSIVDSNALAAQRMETSQLAMGQMAASAQSILDTFVGVTGASDGTSSTVAANTALAELENFAGVALTSVNGEFVFSGINTDAQTLPTGFIDDIKQDFSDALDTYLAANGLGSVSDMTGDDVDAFIADYTAAFDWSSWTNASDTVMSSRISMTETVKTSASLNGDGFKNLVLSAIIGSQLTRENMQSDALAQVKYNVVEISGAAVSGINAAQSQLGLSQSRIENANETLATQKTIIDTQLSNLVSVDQYEANVRLTALMTQLETSYTITAKIQQLSLVNFL